MFIELAEHLRCPEGHSPDPYLVLVPDEMVGRSVVRGAVACPTCRRAYAIANAVVVFGERRGRAAPAAAVPDADVVQALLGLGGPGGYVVLVGSAATLALGLAQRMGGVHFVAVNPSEGVEPSPLLTVVHHPAMIPLKTVARGMVLGAEYGTPSWLSEAARVLLRGRRLVALRERGAERPDVRQLAVGKGMWVGEKM